MSATLCYVHCKTSSVGCAKGYRADDRSFSLFVLCGLAGLQDGQDISTEGDAAGCTSAVLCVACFCGCTSAVLCVACFCLDGHWGFFCVWVFLLEVDGVHTGSEEELVS